MTKIPEVIPARRSILWLREALTEKQFIFFSAVLVGISAGLGAVLLKLFAHFIRTVVVEDYLFTLHFKYIYLVLPVLGIAITIFITRRVLGGRLTKGTAAVMSSILKKGSMIPPKEMYGHVITSAFTVGFGGSAGLESPIVSTGSAIGSNYARIYKLSYRYRTLLIAAGAAGGIAAAFNAPIAGILFALEVLLIQVTVSSFVPLLIAAASGAIVSKIILHEDILINFRLQQPFDYYYLPWYLLLGLACGTVSVFYTNVFSRIEKTLAAYRSRFNRFLIGGIALGVLILVFPALYGEGYNAIKALAYNRPELLVRNSILDPWVHSVWILGLMILGTMLLKAIAVACTLGSGGNGGNFAPSLFVGACLGFLFSYVLTNLGMEKVPYHNFTIVAMAGILAGIFHAPLTAIFLIAEITGGYELIIPLMIVSSLGYGVSRYFHPDSIEVRNLKSKGIIVSEEKDISILSKIELPALIESYYTTLREETTLRDVLNRFRNSQQHFFPVVNKEGDFKGVVSMEIIRRVMFNESKELERKASEVLEIPVTVGTEDSISAILKKFEETGEPTLIVQSAGKYKGTIDKSVLLERYRKILIQEL